MKFLVHFLYVKKGYASTSEGYPSSYYPQLIYKYINFLTKVVGSTTLIQCMTLTRGLSTRVTLSAKLTGFLYSYILAKYLTLILRISLIMKANFWDGANMLYPNI